MKDLNFYAVDKSDKDKCFWCSQDIAYTEDDYTPCKHCAERIEEGVMIIEMMENPRYIGQPIMGNGYPTGNWGIITVEMARFLFPDKAFMEGVILPVNEFIFQAIKGNLGRA